MYKNTGITLISLILTIIILIILAGVSINLTLGEEGIITLTQKAKENIELAQIEEQLKLNQLYDQIAEESGGSISYDSIVNLREFKKALADYIESKNVDRPETAGDSSVYINRFEEVLLKEQNKLTEFKTKIASAITEMGVQTSENADVSTMVNNIKSISTKSPQPLIYNSYNNNYAASVSGKTTTVTTLDVSDYKELNIYCTTMSGGNSAKSTIQLYDVNDNLIAQTDQGAHLKQVVLEGVNITNYESIIVKIYSTATATCNSAIASITVVCY